MKLHQENLEVILYLTSPSGPNLAVLLQADILYKHFPTIKQGYIYHKGKFILALQARAANMPLRFTATPVRKDIFISYAQPNQVILFLEASTAPVFYHQAGFYE